MKKLSDYKGDDAIELWADLLDPLTTIFTDNEIKGVVQQGKNKIIIAKTLLKKHKSEAVEIMTRIDPEPIDGLNIITRLIALLSEIGENEEIKSFFGYAEEVKTDSESSGLHMVNTEAKEN